MKVLDTNIKSRVALMKATKSAGKLSTLPDGTALTGMYVHYIDNNSNGEEVELIAVEGQDHNWYGSNSETFCREFLSYMTDEELLNCGEEFTLVKDSGKTKSGRDYVTCHIA